MYANDSECGEPRAGLAMRNRVRVHGTRVVPNERTMRESLLPLGVFLNAAFISHCEISRCFSIFLQDAVSIETANRYSCCRPKRVIDSIIISRVIYIYICLLGPYDNRRGNNNAAALRIANETSQLYQLIRLTRSDDRAQTTYSESSL